MADPTTRSIAHDVAVESEMAHESLSTLTAVIQEGIDRAMVARAGLPPETIAELRRLCEAADIERWPSSEGAIIQLASAAREWLPKLLDMVGSPLLAGEPDGMETTEEERAQWTVLLTRDLASINRLSNLPRPVALMLLRDIDRLLARKEAIENVERLKADLATCETKAREEEREACAVVCESLPGQHSAHATDATMRTYTIRYSGGRDYAATIRARSKPQTGGQDNYIGSKS